MITFKRDNTNRTIGFLEYRYIKGTKVMSINVGIGYPSEMNADAIQDLLESAFMRMENLVKEIK